MRIEYSERAQKEILALPDAISQRIVKKVKACAEDEPLRHATKLQPPYEQTWRFRVGDYRVLFEIVKQEVRVLHVLRVKHRKDVYK